MALKVKGELSKLTLIATSTSIEEKPREASAHLISLNLWTVSKNIGITSWLFIFIPRRFLIWAAITIKAVAEVNPDVKHGDMKSTRKPANNLDQSIKRKLRPFLTVSSCKEYLVGDKRHECISKLCRNGKFHLFRNFLIFLLSVVTFRAKLTYLTKIIIFITVYQMVFISFESTGNKI